MSLRASNHSVHLQTASIFENELNIYILFDRKTVHFRYFVLVHFEYWVAFLRLNYILCAPAVCIVVFPHYGRNLHAWMHRLHCVVNRENYCWRERKSKYRMPNSNCVHLSEVLKCIAAIPDDVLVSSEWFPMLHKQLLDCDAIVRTKWHSAAHFEHISCQPNGMHTHKNADRKRTATTREKKNTHTHKVWTHAGQLLFRRSDSIVSLTTYSVAGCARMRLLHKWWRLFCQTHCYYFGLNVMSPLCFLDGWLVSR